MEKTTTELPQGWFVAGNNPDDYTFTVDKKMLYEKRTTASISAKKEKVSGFGTLMQDFQATAYRGKRMKLTAVIKSKDVADWAGLWMQIEGYGGDILGFDNMRSRGIKGTTDWTEYSLVLDISEASMIIGFGILLSGKGNVWIADVRFDAVDKTIATTNLEKLLPLKPTNLDFQT